MSHCHSGTDGHNIVCMYMSTICLDVPVPDNVFSSRLRDVETGRQLSCALFQSNCQNKLCVWSGAVFFKKGITRLSFV